MMSEVLCIEVTSVFFLFFLSISAAPSTKRKLRAWWDVKWWGRSVWNLLLNNVTTGNPNSEPGITEASSHQLTQNPKMYWSPHCCWWGKPISLPHRGHGTKHTTNVAVTRAGWGREGAPKSLCLPPNRASCLRAMQLFFRCVQYQLESNANYLRRAFQGSQL